MGRLVWAGVGIVALLAGVVVVAFSAAPVPNDRTNADIPSAVIQQTVEHTMTRFDGADDTTKAIAAQIAQGAVPDPDLMSTLSVEALNREYGTVATGDAAPGYGHSLLREAVVSRNLGAADALIAAGADPFFNDNEMAYLAVKMKTAANPEVWWPDFSLGTGFLERWLAAGGDPNAANRYYGRTGNLLVAADPMNLQGILVLLEAGTDPWHAEPVILGGVPQDDTWSPFFELHANVTLISSEMNFRIAQAGLYRGGTPDQHAALVAEYDVGIRNILVGGSGPARDRKAWGVQKALGQIVPMLRVEPTTAMRGILAEDLSGADAGFWLGPGDIRSPNTPAQYMRSDNQWGTERWDD